MPFFTSITRSGVRVWLEALARPGVVYIGGVPIALPAEAGDGIDLVAADVRGDVWVAVVGVGNDRGYLLKMSDGSVTVLGDGPVHGRYPVWITEDGDVSWVPASDPYSVHHLDGRVTPSRDTHHPMAPNESAVEDWGGVRVVNPFRSGSWESSTWADDAPGAQTVLLRMNGGPAMTAGTFRTQLPPHCAEHEDGSCTVPVQVPEGKNSPVFVRSEAFTRFEVPAVVYQPFPDNPHRCAIAIDGEPGGLLLGNADWPTLCRDGVLHDMKRPDQLPRHIELARQAGSPILAYQDTSRPDLSGFGLELPDGVVSLPAFHGYPDKGESPEDHSARMTLLLATMAGMYPAFVVFAAGFTAPGQRGERTLHQVREGLRAIARAAARHPQLRMVVVFSWDRSSHLGPDGVSQLPDVAADVALWRASVRDAEDYPTVSELRPDRQPEPQPQPVEPTPEPEPIPAPERPPVPESEIVYPSPTQAEVDAWQHGRDHIAGMLAEAEALLATLRKGRAPGRVKRQQKIVDGLRRSLPAWPWPHVPEGQAAEPIVVGPPVPSAPQDEPTQRPTREQVLAVRGNFCNLWDSAGRIVYTPALPGAPDDVFDEWMRLQREAGSTHVFFGPPSGGPAYPGTHWENPNYWDDLPAYRRFVEKVLDRGFVPVIFVGGDTLDVSRMDRWIDLADALDGLHEYLIVLPAWEPVVGGWSSAELADALGMLHALFPTSVLGWHGSPTRWVGSSNPLESDDPWQGGESEFYKRHGGEFIDIAFYQTQHGRELYAPCTCPDSPRGEFTHREDCWLNRWEDGVARLGAGHNGWRVLPIVLYETVAYEAFRGQATHDDARRIAAMGKRVSDKWGVSIGFGNGLP